MSFFAHLGHAVARPTFAFLLAARDRRIAVKAIYLATEILAAVFAVLNFHVLFSSAIRMTGSLIGAAPADSGHRDC